MRIYSPRKGKTPDGMAPPGVFCLGKWERDFFARSRLSRDCGAGIPSGYVEHAITKTYAEIAEKARSLYLGTFSQSSRNFFIPASVSGCLVSCMMTEKGMVAMSAPIRAAFRTWTGFRTLATMISASKP